jgi:hypothetical protein
LPAEAHGGVGNGDVAVGTGGHGVLSMVFIAKPLYKTYVVEQKEMDSDIASPPFRTCDFNPIKELPYNFSCSF